MLIKRNLLAHVFELFHCSHEVVILAVQRLKLLVNTFDGSYYLCIFPICLSHQEPQVASLSCKLLFQLCFTLISIIPHFFH